MVLCCLLIYTCVLRCKYVLVSCLFACPIHYFKPIRSPLNAVLCILQYVSESVMQLKLMMDRRGCNLLRLLRLHQLHHARRIGGGSPALYYHLEVCGWNVHGSKMVHIVQAKIQVS